MYCVRIVAAWALAACLLAPARAVTSSSAYQGDAAHDGRVIMSPGFVPPLRQIWSRDLGGYVGYPVVANGLVFVLAGNAVDLGVKLYALDLQTGAIVWAKPLGGILRWSTLAYDNGRIFVANENGVVQAIDADRKGKIAWVRYLFSMESEITATNGHVFVGVYGSLRALNEKNGRTEWAMPVKDGTASPAADDQSVYGSYPCQYYKFDQSTGQQIWNTQLGCHGGGDNDPVYYDQRIYLRDPVLGNQVLDAATGTPTGRPFLANQAPAIWPQPSGQPALMVTFQQSTEKQALLSVDTATGRTNWSFSGEGNDSPSSAPLVLNDMVAEGTSDGMIYLLDAATGKILWSAKAGSTVLSDGTTTLGGNPTNRPRANLGAAEDILLVPANTFLVAFKP